MSIWKGKAFSIRLADSSAFKPQGLPALFECRDLGIAGASKGFSGAHVICAVPRMENTGEHVLREGSCVLQPRDIRWREVRRSDDMELIEAIPPAEFEIETVGAP